MKKIFLDCGANIGQSIDLFIRSWPDAIEYEIHSFEANPDFSETLEKKKESYKDYNITIHNPIAVWDEETEQKLNFHGNGEAGIAVDSETPINHLYARCKRGFKVDSIKLSKFILDNFSKDDYIVLKLDVEGAEYRIIRDLHKHSVLEHIDEFYYEFHGLKKGYSIYDDLECLEMLESSLSSPPKTWDGNLEKTSFTKVTKEYILAYYLHKICLHLQVIKP